MRIFSGSKTPEFPTPPKIFAQDDASSVGSGSPRSRRSSFVQAFSSPRIFSNSSSPGIPPSLPQESSNTDNIPLELVPIVTLLSAHAHRRYCEGVFLILEDLKSDGNPGSRKWKEVYGMLVGTQLALWDAKELAACNTKESKYKLKQVTSKPGYVNFADAAVKSLDGTEAVVTESNKKLNNTLVVSTTLKNRYFLQFNDEDALSGWNAAIQLSLFECTSLQEAYTGAFLSSRGAQLGDIKTLLDSKFDYEDWVSVRFGAGMPWKRCFATITQPNSRKKSALGQISFFENDKKTKKNQAIATVVTSERLYAVYPSSPQLIDSSTIIKLEGSLKFEKKDMPQEASVFIMPEKHHAVPGYDTTIRFLIPAMNAFKLYGRPKKLIANKDDPKSLLFGLPTLPHVHYLKVEELLPLSRSPASASWSSHDWTDNIKEILTNKMSSGYSGCGTSAGVMGAISSPAISSTPVLGGSSPSLLPEVKPERVEKTNKATLSPDHKLTLPNSGSISDDKMLNAKPEVMSSRSNNLLQVGDNKKSEIESTAATSIYSEDDSSKSKSPGKKFGRMVESYDTSPLKDPVANQENDTGDNKLHPTRNPTIQSHKELDHLYHKYSLPPFGKNAGPDTSPQVGEHLFDNPYRHHGDDGSGMREVTANIINEETETEGLSPEEYDSTNEEEDAFQEFNDLAKRINELNIGAAPGPERRVPQEKVSPWDKEPPSADATRGDEDNVFDPDFMEQNEMLEMDSKHTGNESLSDASSEDPFNGVNARGLGLETVPPSGHNQNVSKLPQQKPDPVEDMNAKNINNNLPPAGAANPYGHEPRTTPLSNMPYGQRQPPLTNYPPQPMMKQVGGFPSYNYPPQQSHHRKYPNPNHHRPHVYGPPRPYPMNGVPNRNYVNGFPPQQRMHPGVMGPNQQMYPYGGRAGPYPPPGQHKPPGQPKPPPTKAKNAMDNGFSRFMPSATVNPYSK
ncbi:hypothetical protein ZYGR_0W00390 [Zygosaccharomyces rouxii]|uniref:ZYRO0F17072p n=2 Tax=Zygosaccharomyces rouxii TaxID=4956 RepID=C5DZ00_ZYGRC|nr:uncharacterized protein ZYRO0F17072g [Zygosaccharomyces rouxii]KAH9201277.1 protein SKG3 and CCR4-NOT transcriptional complex subunit CAF120 [Zygosaccharomyces rouxii]GAV50513.1 hypothetical protein ZYGR_0W00390 [Zygosaccharomyces rouxii]CAQ43363.1 Protein SKG3 and CCR4-NOT transcriptional complex subunit CAF120 [Zygosaccharomyces rouxii]CAR29011.1 ZYRO0F17072p [Zygosaccharomyces rouxii]